MPHPRVPSGMGAFQNRRFRFQVADKLWRECAGLVTPEQIVEIADSVEEELSGHRDGLALIHSTVARRGFTGKQVHQISVLVSMLLIDRVNIELASLKAERRDCR
jgi:hypothetical protein